jgi:UDP-glucose 4-epimerase
MTEETRTVPKNIYGVTKVTAENLCEMFHHCQGLACLVMRTSRFFPKPDDDSSVRKAYQDANLKVNEYLYRRGDLQDIVDAHLLALEKAPSIGFGRCIISASTPFRPEDLTSLRNNAPKVVERRVPQYADVYARRGWKMFPGIERVYINERARKEPGWQPKYDFPRLMEILKAGNEPFSPLARLDGSKGYHDCAFAKFEGRHKKSD